MTHFKALSAQRAWRAGALVTAVMLAACAVELENKQPAQELARAAQAPGSVYIGWRVFQDRCAACHGPDALGVGQAPNLLTTMRDMGPRRFVGLVLQRYDWALPPDQARKEGAALDQLVDQILQRQGPLLTMPAWQGEPRVSAHITDLYAYLSARAQGTQGIGRPTP